jgi:type IV pilus assembly protein PilB
MAVATERSLGQVLIDLGVLSPLDLEHALQRQRVTGELLGRVLVGMELVGEQEVVEALGVQLGLERVDLDRLTMAEETLRSIPPHVARFYQVAPVRIEENGALTVAMADPLNVSIIGDLEHLLGRHVVGAVSNPDSVRECISKNYVFETDKIGDVLQELVEAHQDHEIETIARIDLPDIENIKALANEPEIIKMVNLLLMDAVSKRASDIHFEPYEGLYRVRMRIDGTLYQVLAPPPEMALSITSRLKVVADLNLAERRLPQDGRIQLNVGGSEVDVRVSCLPTLFGESIVLRILDRNALSLDLENLGLEDEQKKVVRQIINKPNGIFLVTGPTGCGKTTTLYASLQEINDPQFKIITTEDPVEYPLQGIIQVAIKEEMGLTFAASLRSILRQDPDKVMVGEIRDLETAEIAIEASLTGHLVLSTLHTNDAPETVTRLLDMEVEPYLITSSLEAVLAQRLVRVLCKFCKEAYEPTDDELERMGIEREEFGGKSLYREKGCPACEFRGFTGRTGIFELMVLDETMREMINQYCTALELRRYAQSQGMKILRDTGLEKVREGVTTLKEILFSTEKYD